MFMLELFHTTGVLFFKPNVFSYRKKIIFFCYKFLNNELKPHYKQRQQQKKSLKYQSCDNFLLDFESLYRQDYASAVVVLRT